MAVQTALKQPRTSYSSTSSRSEGNYFLEGLRHIEFGQITITTPENNVMEFSGPRHGPSGHLHLHDWAVLDELVGRGEIGFAEAYMEGRWDSPDLAALLTFGLVNTGSLERFFHGRPLYALWLRFKHALSGNSMRGSRRNVAAHYDLGNDFYALWLDAGMTYSGGIFGDDVYRSLEDAQAAKYRRILGKLAARSGDHVLEIGCGWGGFAEAAARDGLRVTAVTLSQQQAAYAQERLKRQGLDALASVELEDYRNIEGMFDHIVSIGMFEHVGEGYWPTYFETIKRRLKKGGRAMVQSITLDDALFESLQGTAGFIETYIFPGGMLPSKARFRKALTEAGLECREIFGFGADYARTVRHWLERFEARKDQVMRLGYDERFIRMWRFYLSSCIASFLSKRCDGMQAEITHALPQA